MLRYNAIVCFPLFSIESIQIWILFKRLNYSPCDKVRKGRFRLTMLNKVIVDESPVFRKHFHGKHSQRGCCGNFDTLVHIFGYLRSYSFDLLQFGRVWNRNLFGSNRLFNFCCGSGGA